jgi:hypothetical protein
LDEIAPFGAIELIELDTTIEFEEAQHILDNERIKDALKINCLWFELNGPVCKSASRSYWFIGAIYLPCFPVLYVRELQDSPSVTK